jgi:hypothetical protein
MIRPLRDINDEFRAELAAEAPPDRTLPPAGGKADAADPIATFDAAPKRTVGRRLPRHAIPILIAVVAIILIVFAGVFALRGTPAQEDASDASNRTQEDGAPGADAEAGEGSAPAPDEGAGEYDSALESLENEINSLRESGETGEDADLSGAVDAPSRTDIAALYGCVVGAVEAEAVIRDATAAADGLLLRRDLIERIDAHLAADAGGKAVSLPSDTVINSDLSFTALTEPANALIDAVNAGFESADRLPEVIDLRRRAYEIYPLRVLKKLLAIDYEDWGLYCTLTGRSAADAFDAFIHAIEYRVAYLRDLPPESESRRAELRRIGGTYAALAEIDEPDAARARHAARLADCFYDMATR